jgi:O-antigen/teichoic acid export membrane protein
MPALAEAPAAPVPAGLVPWLRRIRNSSRLAFMLQLGARIATSLMALIWTRLLLRAMGKPLYGLFLSFQNIAQLGGVGDLGMGGAVNIQTGQYLGQGRHEELKQFLSAARAIFLTLALSVAAGFLVFMPWLANPLGFKPGPDLPVSHVGSFLPLFACGAVAVGMLVASSYVNNLNYACGTLTWPVIPIFVLLQCSLMVHWSLARQGCPLWMQYCPYAVSAMVNFLLACLYLRAGFPDLARILPLRFDLRLAATLFERSFWMYLNSLGNLVYVGTSALVIQAWFGSAQVPVYRCNYRVCELAVFMILSASFVAVPKFTQWLADPSPETREKVLTNLRRLNQFQTFAGCVGALGYLAINNFFMIHWLGRDMLAPLAWQSAFALNLAVTTSGDAAIQAASRCGRNGIRVTGGFIGVTALINVSVSILAAHFGRLGGVALAAGIAQSLLSISLGIYVCGYLKLSWVPWVARTWLLPASVVAIAATLRMRVPMDSAPHVLLIAGVYAGMAVAVLLILGINRKLIREEMAIVRSFLPGK